MHLFPKWQPLTDFARSAHHIPSLSATVAPLIGSLCSDGPVCSPLRHALELQLTIPQAQTLLCIAHDILVTCAKPGSTSPAPELTESGAGIAASQAVSESSPCSEECSTSTTDGAAAAAADASIGNSPNAPADATACLQPDPYGSERAVCTERQKATKAAADEEHSGGDQLQQRLRELLLEHCSPSPGVNGQVEGSFAPHQISSLAKFFCRGMLQHKALYQYAWSQSQHHQEHKLHLMVSSTPGWLCSEKTVHMKP